MMRLLTWNLHCGHGSLVQAQAQAAAIHASDADVAPFTFLSSVEVIDPGAGNVTAGPPLPEANLSLRSTILFDGSIVAGGGTPCGSKAVSYASVYFLEAPPDIVQ